MFSLCNSLLHIVYGTTAHLVQIPDSSISLSPTLNLPLPLFSSPSQRCSLPRTLLQSCVIPHNSLGSSRNLGKAFLSESRLPSDWMVDRPQAGRRPVINRPSHRRSICYMLHPTAIFCPLGKFRVLSAYHSLEHGPVRTKHVNSNLG